MSDIIKNRIDFLYLFDCKNGNPNGDPDMDGAPRVDPEDQKGRVTDGCIKRKIRNYIQQKYELKDPYNIFVREGVWLNSKLDEAQGKTSADRKDEMCAKYYDIRAFGQVMNTGDKKAGTVRGPVQFTIAESIDPVSVNTFTVTRCVVTTEKEYNKQKSNGEDNPSTMGKKSAIPYGLYLAKGYLSPYDAVISGFSEKDLDVLWDALTMCFEMDRASSRGEMSMRKLYIFKHDNALGRARASELFDRVSVKSRVAVPRDYSDYEIIVDKSKLPKGVELVEI